MVSGSSGGDTARPVSADGGEALLGRVLDGRYRIHAVLGTGGVGVVYRAEHTALARPVAIKVLHGYFGEREDLRLRFEREAKVLSALAHPHIVAITDYGVAEGMPYLAMELLEGCTLAELLRERGPLAPETALDIARGILRGLAFAHARGVLHRDLKPANVFLQRLPDDPYHVKLLDFGLAKMVEPDDEEVDELTLTRSGTVLGTPAYMSPEQASGATVDAPTDVYSAGCVLYELFGGQPPFRAETRPELIRKHMLSPVRSLAEIREGAQPSPELEAVLEKALAKDPRERFADAGEMLAAVDALPRPPMAGVGGTTLPARESGAHPRGRDASEAPTVRRGAGTGAQPQAPAGASPERRSFGWVGIAAMVLGTALAGAGVWLAWRSAIPDEPDPDFEGPTEEIPLIASDDPDRSPEALQRRPAGREPATPQRSEDARREGSRDPSPSEARASTDQEGGGVGGTAEKEPGGSAEKNHAETEANTPASEASPSPSDSEGSRGARGGSLEEGGGVGGTAEKKPSASADKPTPRHLLAGSLPRALRPYWARVRRGRPLTRSNHRILRRYQQRASSDPRPSLLLGHDFHRRGWLSDALTRYEAAHEIDPASRGDPRMLRNLVDMASNPAVDDRAGKLVEAIYGAEALDTVDRALAREKDDRRKKRLEALKRRLAR